MSLIKHTVYNEKIYTVETVAADRVLIKLISHFDAAYIHSHSCHVPLTVDGSRRHCVDKVVYVGVRIDNATDVLKCQLTQRPFTD